MITGVCPQGMTIHKITRPWELGKESGAHMSTVLWLLRSLGYRAISSSTRLDLEPTERESLVAVLRRIG